MVEPASVPPPRPNGPRPSRLSAALQWAIVVCAALIVAAIVLHTPILRPVPAPVVPTYTPQQAAAAQRHMDALREQWQAAIPSAPEPASPAARTRSAPGTTVAPGTARTPGQARTPGTDQAPDTPRAPETLHFELSQDDLNTFLATNPHARSLLQAKGVQAVQLVLQPPHDVLVRAAIRYKGRDANLQVTGALLPSPDTGLRFVAKTAQIAAVPLPAATATAQADRIAAALASKAHGRLPVTIQQVQIVGDRLILTGVRRG